MEKMTTQDKFTMLRDTMINKLDLIASYTINEMDEFAMIELESLERYLRLQHTNIVDVLPGKLIKK